jgi:hypothetical protein
MGSLVIWQGLPHSRGWSPVYSSHTTNYADGLGRMGSMGFPPKKPTTHLDQRNFYARVLVPAVKKAGLKGVTWHTFAAYLRLSAGLEWAKRGNDSRPLASFHHSLAQAVYPPVPVPPEDGSQTGRDVWRHHTQFPLEPGHKTEQRGYSRTGTICK